MGHRQRLCGVQNFQHPSGKAAGTACVGILYNSYRIICQLCGIQRSGVVHDKERKVSIQRRVRVVQECLAEHGQISQDKRLPAKRTEIQCQVHWIWMQRLLYRFITSAIANRTCCFCLKREANHSGRNRFQRNRQHNLSWRISVLFQVVRSQLLRHHVRIKLRRTLVQQFQLYRSEQPQPQLDPAHARVCLPNADRKAIKICIECIPNALLQRQSTSCLYKLRLHVQVTIRSIIKFLLRTDVCCWEEKML